MDKLRAIEYFLRTADTGSFGNAARMLDVSTPAVTQLVAALERSLGTILLHRSSRGVALTADGERYYQVACAAYGELLEVEKLLGPRGARPRGTLTVGMRSGVAQACVMPQIGRFLLRYPDVELVLKPAETLADIESQDVDVAVMTGWPPAREFAVRVLAHTRHVVCASGEYWRRMGVPSEPEALAGNECLVMRSSGGTLLDRWIFERNGERRTIDVRPRLLSYQSTWIQAAACAGAGVIRVADFSVQRELAAGALKPVLLDWEALEAPMHFAVYRPKQRQSRLVRVFVDFLVDVFSTIDGGTTGQPGGRTPKPEWFGRVQGRQSAFASRRKKSAA